MILSPPFLPNRQTNETDDQFIDRAMAGGQPGDGGYPVSFEMNWHGGLHLTAPPNGDNAGLPVRAIADGEVMFMRLSTKRNNDPLHPLNYRGGWTHDGCVILRHQTEIGADANSGAATVVVYYSIYMHLQTVSAGLKQGDRVYRKQMLGAAGSIYGIANRIHFEIICDDANVRGFTGRSDTYTAVDKDGRTDVIFGAIHFLLLVDTHFLASDPRDATSPPAVAFTSEKGMFVVMIFVRGNCIMQSLDLGGNPIGSPQIDTDYEYQLFATASQNYPHSPSAGYELLRFGRVLGPDTLNPADAPHWRKVSYPGGVGWVNLNGSKVRKFSDADFPFWDNWWMLIDASSSADSRCRDVKILELLDSNGDLKVTPKEAQQNLNKPGLQLRLSHKICKFPTEWDANTIDSHWSWLKTDPETKMDDVNFSKLKAHISALCFWQQANLGINGTHWHFHPREFIRHFRKCGWLSLDELTQLMPRRAGPTQGDTVTISWVTAQSRFSPYALNLNKTFRKFNLWDAYRQTHFLAQTFIETALWRTMREFGRGHQQRNKDGTAYWPAPNMEFYTVFYGRGLMQLTWPENYEAYGIFRQYAPVVTSYTYQDNRITHTSTHHWAGRSDTPRRWYPRFDPEIIADDPIAACDSAGFYWVSKVLDKHYPTIININSVADQPFSTNSVGRISVLVNGGVYGFAERQSYAAFIKRYRDDDTATIQNTTFAAQHGTNQFTIFVDFSPQRP